MFDNDEFEEFCYKRTLYHFLRIYEAKNPVFSKLTMDE